MLNNKNDVANFESRKIAVDTRIDIWAGGTRARSDLVTGYLTCIGPHSVIWLGLGGLTWSQARCGGIKTGVQKPALSTILCEVLC